MSHESKKIALVTGANRGIGLEVSKQLAQKGVLVILSSRSREAGEAVVFELQNQNLEVKYHQLDVTDAASIDQIHAWIKKEFGRLDILVNNAGIAIDLKNREDWNDPEKTSIFNIEVDCIRRTLETNTYGPIQLIQKFVPMMKVNGYGRIVNVSSGMGQLSEMGGGWPGYRLSKTALNAVTRIVSAELQDSGVLINSVCPGWVRTDLGGPEAALSVEEGADTVVWLATLLDGEPSGEFFRNREKIAW